MGGLYRTGSSHADSPGTSVRGGSLYRSGTGGGAAPAVRAVVTPGGALYRTGSNAPAVAAVRSTAGAAQAIGVVVGASTRAGEECSRLWLPGVPTAGIDVRTYLLCLYAFRAFQATG